MKRKNKIIFGAIAIILVFISAFIGFFLLSDVGETYSFATRFVLRFPLTFTPVFTILAILNLLKNDKDE